MTAIHRRPLVVFGLLGTTLDGAGTNPGRKQRAPPGRWEKWRPTVDLCRHDDFIVDRLELLHQPEHGGLATTIAEDILAVSPETSVGLHPLAFKNPWDFGEVYAGLHDFAANWDFDDDVDYGIHITTGTHTAQICWFLLAESRRIPARLIQTGPPRRKDARDSTVGAVGTVDVIDLDLSRYDQLASRFDVERDQSARTLAGGIESQNPAMRAMLQQLERVATSSTAPLLLCGPTGVGKTQMARRVYELKRHRRQVQGAFLEVNCATLRGDAAMSTLFGHKKGSYTGAVTDRVGVLKAADKGLVFLDEVGELGLDEQAMLLKAIEDKRFTPMGADVEVSSDFQLVCGTHRDLVVRCQEGRFREDLLARIDIWRFDLPSLAARPEDMAPNLEVELARVAAATGRQVRFSSSALQRFLAFATASTSTWPGNFREFGACILRMGTLCDGGRITDSVVDAEVDRLQQQWNRRRPMPPATPPAPPTSASSAPMASGGASVSAVLAGLVNVDDLDDFAAVQLAHVVVVCRRSASLAAAGRALFAVSRTQKKAVNDTDRLRKYLMGNGIDPDDVVGVDGGIDQR